MAPSVPGANDPLSNAEANKRTMEALKPLKELIPLQLEAILPNNVNKPEQLALLPEECLSGNTERPLRHFDDLKDEYHYALKPMFHSVFLILFVETLERFSFYGINYTQTSYLTGTYDPDWNAGLGSIQASSYVSISTAIAYTAPFLGAALADSFLGDFRTILFGTLVLYIPGVLLIALTTIPDLLGTEFNSSLLRLGLLCLWPIGTGTVKSVVNVFGAKQHHPLLQSALIETYYVNFYMCINTGALVGGLTIPIVAQYNVTFAYFIPVGILTVGILSFASGSRRYVKTKPRGDLFSGAVICTEDAEEVPSVGLGVTACVSMLVIPFNIAYSQMATTFIVQGTVMKTAFGFIDPSTMNNCDAIAVLCSGYLIGNKLYPYLAKRDIKLQTTHKFALGSTLGAMAIGWALMIDYWIQNTYETTGEHLSVLWQAPSYMLIGTGEIFAVSAAYEVAFTIAPPQKKGLASAANLFFIGGVPNLICIFLYHFCRGWFQNSEGEFHISTLENYSEAQVIKYFWLLFGIAIFGIFLNLLPQVREWVESIEERAAELIKTPSSTPTIGKQLKKKIEEKALMANENDALICSKKHQDYLKYGTGPVLYKHGSMRAGPTLSHKEQKTLKPKFSYLHRQLNELIIPKGTPRAAPTPPT